MSGWGELVAVRAKEQDSLVLDLRTAATRRQSVRRTLLLKLSVVTVDAGSIAAGMALAFAFRGLLPAQSPTDLDGSHLRLAILAMPMWLFIFAHHRLYRTRHVQGRVQEFKRMANAVGTSVLGMTFLGTMLGLSVSRTWLLLCLPSCILSVAAGRHVVRRVFERLRRGGRLLRQVVIVGSNSEGMALCEMLESEPGLGYEVVGFVDQDAARTYRRDRQPVETTDVEDLVAAVRSTGATGALVATTSVDLETVNRLARQLTDAGIHVELSSSLRDIAAERLTLRLLGRCPVVYVEPVRRRGWRAVAKRVFDIGGAIVGLTLTLPLLALAAIAIKIDSPGPVLFRQKRVGRDGKLFDVLKLRTMVTNAEELKVALLHRNEAHGPLFKIRNDPRVTRVGRRLRALSIDEVPQLWNVLRGEMSLVGPRPAIPDEAATWDQKLHQRVRVRPGLTGMWQVNGRSSSSFEDYVRFDLYYVDNWSLWSDLAILAKTLPVLLSRRGAY